MACCARTTGVCKAPLLLPVYGGRRQQLLLGATCCLARHAGGSSRVSQNRNDARRRREECRTRPVCGDRMHTWPPNFPVANDANNPVMHCHLPCKICRYVPYSTCLCWAVVLPLFVHADLDTTLMNRVRAFHRSGCCLGQSARLHQQGHRKDLGGWLRHQK